MSIEEQISLALDALGGCPAEHRGVPYVPVAVIARREVCPDCIQLAYDLLEYRVRYALDGDAATCGREDLS